MPCAVQRRAQTSAQAIVPRARQHGLEVTSRARRPPSGFRLELSQLLFPHLEGGDGKSTHLFLSCCDVQMSQHTYAAWNIVGTIASAQQTLAVL